MKELRIEDKAKRYDEAIERAKYWEKNPTVWSSDDICQKLFPELKESEDEKIRKWIKKELESKYVVDNTVNNVMADKAPAWLEKQGEQKPEGKTALEAAKEENVDNQNCVKPADKVETRFHEGDWVIVSTAEGDRVIQIASVEYFKDGHPSYFTTEGRWFSNGTKARLLTDKDVETITLPESKVIVSKIKSWNEEDEEMKTLAIDCIESMNPLPTSVYTDCINWLKSLKNRVQPQNQWKPSEGQLECLGYAIEKAEKDWSPLTNNRIYLTLKALKEQLLELMGSKV